jgi:hypothetical protein
MNVDQSSATGEYILEPWDIAAGRIQFGDNGSKASVMAYCTLLLLLTASGALALAWHESRKELGSYAFIMFLTVSFFGCFFFAMALFVARIMITWKAPKSCRPLVGLPHRLSIAADGLTATGVGAQTVYFWPSIGRIDATAAHAFFHTTPNTVVVVPRRAFSSDDAFRGFVERARRHCGEAAYSTTRTPQSASLVCDGDSFEESTRIVPTAQDERI